MRFMYKIESRTQKTILITTKNNTNLISQNENMNNTITRYMQQIIQQHK